METSVSDTNDKALASCQSSRAPVASLFFIDQGVAPRTLSHSVLRLAWSSCRTQGSEGGSDRSSVAVPWLSPEQSWTARLDGAQMPQSPRDQPNVSSCSEQLSQVQHRYLPTDCTIRSVRLPCGWWLCSRSPLARILIS